MRYQGPVKIPEYDYPCVSLMPKWIDSFLLKINLPDFY